MVGVAAIAAQGDWSRLAGLAFNVGDLMMLIACLLYAGYTLGLRERPRVSPLGFLAGMALAAFVTSMPLFVVRGRGGRLHLADRRRVCCCCSTPRSGPPSPRSCSTCAASN